MSHSRNIIGVHFGESRSITLRLYPREAWWFPHIYKSDLHARLGPIGYRKLDSDWSRFAIDIGKLSVVFENYKLG